MTNASFTDRHAIVSTPLPEVSGLLDESRQCFASQVGVNAPGTENSTTFFPLKYSSALIFCGPSLVASVSVPGRHLVADFDRHGAILCLKPMEDLKGSQERFYQRSVQDTPLPKSRIRNFHEANEPTRAPGD